MHCTWQIFETRSCQYNIGANLSPMGHGKDLIAQITCHFESGIIVLFLIVGLKIWVVIIWTMFVFASFEQVFFAWPSRIFVIQKGSSSQNQVGHIFLLKIKVDEWCDRWTCLPASWPRPNLTSKLAHEADSKQNRQTSRKPASWQYGFDITLFFFTHHLVPRTGRCQVSSQFIPIIYRHAWAFTSSSLRLHDSFSLGCSCQWPCISTRHGICWWTRWGRIDTRWEVFRQKNRRWVGPQVRWNPSSPCRRYYRR